MGRSYVRKGVSIGVPRYSFDPKVGDEFYISGKLVRIKHKDSEGMLWFNRAVDGTVAMSESNLYQAAYVPETSRFAPYEIRRKQTTNPRNLPTSFIPAKFKTRNGTVSGEVRRNPKTGRVQIRVNPAGAKKLAKYANPVNHEVVEVRYTEKGPVTKVIARLQYHKAVAKIARMKKKYLDRSYRLGSMAWSDK